MKLSLEFIGEFEPRLACFCGLHVLKNDANIPLVGRKQTTMNDLFIFLHFLQTILTTISVISLCIYNKFQFQIYLVY